jgi:hypothetical protein
MSIWKTIKSFFVQRQETNIVEETPITTHVDEQAYWSVVSDADPNKPDKYKTTPAIVEKTFNDMMDTAKETSKSAKKKPARKKTAKKASKKKVSK